MKKILATALAAALMITSAPAAFAAEETAESLDDLTVTTYFTEKTDFLELKSGESYTIKFNNKSNGTNNWENYILAVAGATGAAYTGADQEVLVLRADNWGWGGGMSDLVAPNAEAGNKLVFDTNIVWESWVAAMQAGCDVEITISRDGDTLKYDAQMGDYYDRLTATSGKALPESLYVFLTGENCVLTGITATKHVTDTGSEETDLGDLTVTTYFTEKTDFLELKSGESYTIKFNNKSNGTENYENYILAVAGATGAAYTGADQEVLVLRADNWGWGGGMSDLVAPNAEGNKLVFDTNIVWESWVAAMQAGCDVEITISRDGDTLKYDAQMGDYYDRLTATSGKALPETLYVFLTGENCVLTGITATKSGEAAEDKEDEPVAEDEETGVQIFAEPDVVPEGVTLNVEPVEDSDVEDALLVLDITLTDADDNPVEPDGAVTVKIPVPVENVDKFYVYYQDDNGDLTDMKAKTENGYIVFSTTHFSTYIVSQERLVDDPNAINLGDLTVTTFFNEKTAAVELNSGESYTFKFSTKSNGSANWENFLMAIVGETGAAYTGLEQEILLIRADSWGWGGGYSDFVAPDADKGNKLAFDNNVDWENEWVPMMKAGCDVEITLERYENTYRYNAKIGDYYVSLKATSYGKDLKNAPVYVFLTGENCELTDITATKSSEKVVLSPVPPQTTGGSDSSTDNDTSGGNYIVTARPAVGVQKTDAISGDLTVTGFFNEKTDAVELRNGGSYTFKFNNKSNGSANWENFVMAIVGEIGDKYTGADQEVLIIRADAWGWGGGYSDFVAPNLSGNALVFESDVDWDKWAAGAKAGYDVELTISRDGNTLAYDAKIGDYTVKLTATSGKALPGSLYVFFTGENCVLSGISTTNNNPSAVENTTNNNTPSETNKPSNNDVTVSEPAAQPINLGDLTVTDFFGAKTDSITLKSGDSYTIKFNNKSNGTNNWDNFLLAITGATGAAYTGADQEVLVIRADNWGWGGGMSDFVAPDQAGNALVFESNIDWDKWVSMMQAGCNVEITLSRSGNTLNYYAVIGEYYVKLAATSGKALPETLYVFLTGENCVLSGITATPLNAASNNGGSGSTGSKNDDLPPKTGNAAPYSLAVMAVVSLAAAVVIQKKKSVK